MEIHIDSNGELQLDIAACLKEGVSSTERTALLESYSDKLKVNPALTRALVSFQANKSVPFYRWLKYKEAFSSELVRYILRLFGPTSTKVPKVLDPFSGAGTTLTTAAKEGWEAVGIELLPVGAAASRARLRADTVDVSAFEAQLERLVDYLPSAPAPDAFRFPHLKITYQAFPALTEQYMASYKAFVNEIADDDVRFLFWFACLCVLEDVSYTRKDGQYLRWDSRSARQLKSNFHKGVIPELRQAIISKLSQMLEDIKQRNGGSVVQNVEIIEGSCLDELQRLPDGYFDLIVTSPPYCNRYDYTRTYALELAYLGYDEQKVKTLRQALLSCTVENKTKRERLWREYRGRNQLDRFQAASRAFTDQRALQEVLAILYQSRNKGLLNNDNIPNMVENYFFEMSLVIHECARVLAPGGHMVMVNDNVRYVGEEVPVDLILSDFATAAGLSVDNIWVLPKGKGNSSQQMGQHGRQELRKGVYVWSRPR
ncbi:MAG: site-specific DNA-methyltransferase [Armatimonadetes bacterium]|nr:site-specific DNA-methyltransferase [Armatimonadota bacterium]